MYYPSESDGFEQDAEESVEDRSVGGSDASATDYDDDDDDEEESYDDDDDQENCHPNAKKSKAKGGKKSATTSSSSKQQKNKKTIEETYQKKTQLEHILLRPDTYIGSVEPLSQQPMFVLDAETERIRQREITYTPGFYKIFDEIMVNAADNKQRDLDMDRMEVDVDAEKGVISVMNNGMGIPIAKHKEHDCYVATLIFGHLLTGSNFDDNEKKTTGGRNGYGAKLANIFSKKFVIECVDSEKGLKFTQVWRNNMHEAEEPIVKKCSSAEKKNGDYVKITFKPDFERFNMSGLDADAVGLISKRAYDIAGSMANKEGKKLKVYLNGEKVKVKDFKSYLALFDGIAAPVVYEKVGDDWEVGVGSVLDGGGFQQISFVNAIATTKGGGHVQYISDIIVKSLQAAVKKKNKGGKDVKPAQVKNHLSVFINCLVSNPTFDSQTKENLTTKANTFKKSVQLSDQFMKKVEKCGVVESIMQFAKFQEGRALQRKGGTKKNKLKGISKLDDANFAGTAKSKDCTLIITEGDSAKTLAVSGLSVVGRDYYGVFPLKGKPLNVRDATHAQIMKNEEIMNLVEIMGLKFNVTYTAENIKTLRYGHLMIMADQDHDGSHIKGLIINFMHHFWPSLLDVPDFLQQFITPIVKCTKGNKSETFYTVPQFELWKESTGNEGKGWKIKYYKGLGTSTSSEAKDYFSNLDIHEIHFNELSTDIISRSDSEDEMDIDNGGDNIISSGSDLIDMAFSKKKADQRKLWLRSVDKNTYLNYSDAQRDGVSYSDFINKELALFSQYDVQRSLPHYLDGLKISQRKVLYACFKKKLKSEIKVAQLAGYIGEHSAYHHGEMSLHGTIVGMAQTYCGSNNVNLLYPSGQFGTRRMGGKDHASARYIFTRLEKIARAIFHPDDDDLLTYLNDDGLSIEPEYYMPVIPMVLVNGSEGIGTGWSCNIKSHNPREIISNIRKMINKEEPEEMHPYFSGWTGEIIAETGKKNGSYIVRGKIRRISNTTILISELPIGRWTQDYKEKVLEMLMAGAEKVEESKKKPPKKKKQEEEVGMLEDDKASTIEITDFKENHTDTTVSFTVTATKASIDAFEDEEWKSFKLVSTISTKNMTAFDQDGKIRQYKTSLEILREFFRQRMVFYIARKDLLLHKMRKDLSILENKARFVEEVCEGVLIVSNRKRSELLADLKERGYSLFPKDPKDEKSMVHGEESGEESGDDEEEDDSSGLSLSKGFEYLLGMKIWSLTFERAEELRSQLNDSRNEVEKLLNTSPEQIWNDDLDAVEELLDERDEALGVEAKTQKKTQSKKKKKPKACKKQRKEEWDSEMEDEDSESEESDIESDSEDDFVMVDPAPKVKSAPKKVPNKVKSNSRKDKPVPKNTTKSTNPKKNEDEWDSEMEDLESDDDPESDESDIESDSEPAPKAKPEPKKAPSKPISKHQSVLKDFFHDSSDSGAPTEKPVKSKKISKKIHKTMPQLPKKPAAKAKSARSGKVTVAIGISPKQTFQAKKKSLGSSNMGDLQDLTHDSDESNGEMDDFMIDSDESPLKKAPLKPRGVYGGFNRSKAARAARKSDIQDDFKDDLEDDASSDSNGASPTKKKKVAHDHNAKRHGFDKAKPSYEVDGGSCSENESGSDIDSEF